MYANMENPDRSGMLRFLTDELQAAEDAGERGQLAIIIFSSPWLIGHYHSLDYWSCFVWLGWLEPSNRPNESL